MFHKQLIIRKITQLKVISYYLQGTTCTVICLFSSTWHLDSLFIKLKQASLTSTVQSLYSILFRINTFHPHYLHILSYQVLWFILPWFVLHCLSSDENTWYQLPLSSHLFCVYGNISCTNKVTRKLDKGHAMRGFMALHWSNYVKSIHWRSCWWTWNS